MEWKVKECLGRRRKREREGARRERLRDKEMVGKVKD